MSYFADSLQASIKLVIGLDSEVYQIVWTSLKITLSAVLIAGVIAVPLGILVALSEFRGKRFLLYLLNTLMALPTVMIGLIFYGLLSRSGPLGELGLLYTQTAVVIGECALIFPIIMNLSISAVRSADERLLPTLLSLGAGLGQQVLWVLSETRFGILAAVVLGFGRAIGEVGAAMMLGGNIQGLTRTMTTAIVLQTSKGEFELGLALGMMLLAIAFIVNLILQTLTNRQP